MLSLLPWYFRLPSNLGRACPICESALEAGPRLEPIQAIEFLAKSRRLGGSRSAPIGTPPRTKFTLANQRAKAGWRWGPYSGLIHIEPLSAIRAPKGSDLS